jgi:chemotaxis protein methyltransferase CheR
MTGTISDTLLSRLSKLLASQIGLHFPRQRWSDLERGIRSALRDFGFKDEESCMQWLISAPLTKNQIEILASHLTVGETYFFRDKKSFEMLADHVLADLIRSRRNTDKHLRIWSAGCATGEEPYSIAILLSKMLPDLTSWNITILATDINPRFLRKASEGIYGEWSFRDTPPWVKERYFRMIKQGRFELLPSVRNMVRFSYLNLMEDTYPSLTNNTNAMDVIFCRNVLMYFNQERQRKVIQNLYRCLVDGGWLFVSPSETSHVLFSELRTVHLGGLICYRKEGGKMRTAEYCMGQDIAFHPATEKTAYSVQHQLDYIPGQEPEITASLEPCIQKPAQEATPYEVALKLYERGCYEEAVDTMRFVLSENKTGYEAIALAARAYANQGKLSEAMEWSEKAIAEDKMNPASYYLLATIQQEKGHAGEAVKSLRRALYLDQNFVLAHFTLGNLARQQKKFREAKKHFENALSLLSAYRREDVLPESEGITAGRMIEIIRFTIDDCLLEIENR